MSAKTKELPTKPEQLPATQPSGGALQVIDYGEEAGAGMEDVGREEYKIPLFALLQPLSPLCKPPTAGGQGLAPGSLYNTATGETHICVTPDGKPVVYTIVPVKRNHNYVEYKPRKGGTAGGFVNIHQPDSELAVILRAAHGKFGKVKILHETERKFIDDGSPNGLEIPSLVEALNKRNVNRLEITGKERSVDDIRAIYLELVTPMQIGNDFVETYYIYNLFLPNPDEVQMSVLPFVSSKIPVYQAFMTRYLSIKYPNAQGQKIGPPLYAHQLLLGSRFERKAKGEYYNYTLALGAEPPIKCRMQLVDPLYQQAKAFYELLKEGKVKVQHQEAAAADAGDGGAPKDQDIPF